MNRRHFLATSSLAAHAAFGQASEEKIATAMIGVGGRGSYLLGGVMAQPNTRVTMVCDIKPDRLDRAATRAGKDTPKTTTKWREVIDNKDVQAIYIATPPHLHSEMAIAALEAGKHVYCEKPVGITPEQVRDLVRAVKKSSKVFVSGQQLRSMKTLSEGVGKIHGGAIGNILMVKAQRHASSDLPYDGTSGDWYYDVTKSGGYLIEQSVHNLDVCNWVINAHPLRASGYGGIALHKNEPSGRTIFDMGSITFEYPNGVMMSFTQNVFHPRAMPGGNQYVVVYGSKAAVDLMPSMQMWSLAGDSRAKPEILAEKQQEQEHAHITAFYDAITKGGKNPADITIGATAALTAILGHDAMSKKKVVEWSEYRVEL